MVGRDVCLNCGQGGKFKDGKTHCIVCGCRKAKALGWEPFGKANKRMAGERAPPINPDAKGKGKGKSKGDPVGALERMQKRFTADIQQLKIST